MSITANSQLQRSDQVSYEIAAGEAMVIHLQTGVYYSLNEVGTVFWNLVDGWRSIADCARAIAREYDAPAEIIETDLIELADQLYREGLLLEVGRKGGLG